MIEVKGVSKTFEGMDALKCVDLHIKRGSIYGLLGTNGAGKTTLLKILAGLYKEDKGVVSINEQSIYENEALKDRVMFLSDFPSFFAHYTVRQMANVYKNLYHQWDEERFQALQEVFELDIHKKIQRFSKGMQRQVAFWLALSTKPDVLILDEPFDGLDPVMRRKVKNLILQDVAEREMTVLVSSHNLREVEDFCDYIGVLHHGTMLFERDLDELKSDIHKVQVAFKGEVPPDFFEAFNVLYTEARGSVMLYIVRGEEEDILSHMNVHKPVLFDLLPLSLEEIFIYEMGEVGYAIKNILV
ncbi:ABC transporter ATP-binding protein [Bacillus kexueae]|uniref:ABC transporter ATP-binding protein n=1 Tax=Aeribacillus kexueae TaxID=2078952 RepID=UPI001FAFA6C5|nr:ABC transporter ATP-binding protein [Bacillus kexueae]